MLLDEALLLQVQECAFVVHIALSILVLLILVSLEASLLL